MAGKMPKAKKDRKKTAEFFMLSPDKKARASHTRSSSSVQEDPKPNAVAKALRTFASTNQRPLLDEEIRQIFEETGIPTRGYHWGLDGLGNSGYFEFDPNEKMLEESRELIEDPLKHSRLQRAAILCKDMRCLRAKNARNRPTSKRESRFTEKFEEPEPQLGDTVAAREWPAEALRTVQKRGEGKEMETENTIRKHSDGDSVYTTASETQPEEPGRSRSPHSKQGLHHDEPEMLKDTLEGHCIKDPNSGVSANDTQPSPLQITNNDIPAPEPHDPGLPDASPRNPETPLPKPLTPGEPPITTSPPPHPIPSIPSATSTSPLNHQHHPPDSPTPTNPPIDHQPAAPTTIVNLLQSRIATMLLETAHLVIEKRCGLYPESLLRAKAIHAPDVGEAYLPSILEALNEPNEYAGKVTWRGRVRRGRETEMEEGEGGVCGEIEGGTAELEAQVERIWGAARQLNMSIEGGLGQMARWKLEIGEQENAKEAEEGTSISYSMYTHTTDFASFPDDLKTARWATIAARDAARELLCLWVEAGRSVWAVGREYWRGVPVLRYYQFLRDEYVCGLLCWAWGDERGFLDEERGEAGRRVEVRRRGEEVELEREKMGRRRRRRRRRGGKDRGKGRDKGKEVEVEVGKVDTTIWVGRSAEHEGSVKGWEKTLELEKRMFPEVETMLEVVGKKLEGSLGDADQETFFGWVLD